MKTMKAAELVLDFDLYPRNNVDTSNVRAMVDALAAGVELPPVIIDRKSKRVIDGFHRTKAALRFHGDDAEIVVIEKNYATEAAMFLDAMKYNASHGARLDSADRARCTIIAERLSIPTEAVAGALHTSVDKIGALRTDRTARDCSGMTIPLKSTIRHMAGKKLTKRQEETNTRSSGMNQVFYVNQVIDLIEAKLLNMEDEGLMERMRVLHGLLEKILVAM